MEKVLTSDAPTSDTRTSFVRTAKRLFAERGFYGTSIASIASELGLTKQALIHHFGTKEKLYGEVLAHMADRLIDVVDDARSADPDPLRQLEELLSNLYRRSFDHPADTQLLMRELLDNKGRAEQAHRWYMKDFLNSMVTMVLQVPGSKLTDTEALARVYLILGAFNYFLISQPTLKQMYGKRTFSALKDVMPTEFQRLVRRSFEG
jgi:AcrR family transcriptional regulator